MTIIESNGNTILSFENNKYSATYKNKTVDLWWYLIDKDVVGWETETKYFWDQYPVPYVTMYAEVINNKGIIVWETTSINSQPQIYQAMEFSINDGWVHSHIYEEPSGKYGSFLFSNFKYPEDQNIEKHPIGSIYPYFHPNALPEYKFVAGGGDGTNFLRAFDQVINPVSLSELIDKKIVSPSVNINSYLSVGTEYLIEDIKDFDGNLHASNETSSDELKSAYKYQGLIDVNKDGINEAIFTNKMSGRWVTASVESYTGTIDFSKYGQGGTTRVVGIYIDPLVTSGDVVQFSDHDSQYRFQNDLKIDNLLVKTSGDFDSDGVQEVYWKTADGSAYLRSLMHSDGNIRYANYQSEEQMSNYLANNGYESIISEII